MTTYQYKGISPDGAKVSGVIKAYDEYEAVARLRERCAVVTRIAAVPETKGAGRELGGLKPRDKELAILCSQFAIILSSGLPIVRCVEMVAAQTRSKALQKTLYKVAEDVSGGYPLAQSFENSGAVFPVTFLETIHAGEQAGTLETCFERLHTYYDKRAKTHAKIVSALTYPALVVVVAVVVFIIIMVVAVPAFMEAFTEFDTELPGITKAMMETSDFLTGFWWVFLLAGLLIWAVQLLRKRTEAGRKSIAEGKLRRSPFRKLHRANAAAQFANTMSTMLSSGLPITKALEVTAGVVTNYAMGLGIRRVREGVEQGRSMAAGMAQDPVFPPMLTEMTGVGERSGNLEKTLDVVGAYFDNEATVFTERFLSLLEPVITIFLAILTVVLLLAVYMPMFSLYGSIG